MSAQIKNTLSKKQRFQIEKLSANGKISEAQSKLVEICQRSPRNLDAWLLLADLCQKVNDKANAVTCLNKVLHIDQKHNVARKKLAIIYNAMAQTHIEAGEKEKANAIYTNALSLDPDNIQVLGGFSALLIDCREEIKSIPYLEKALTLQPNSAALFYLLGLAYEKTTGIERSSFYYTKAHELEPDDPRYLLSYARTLNFNGEYSSAEAILNNLFKQDSNNPTIVTELLLTYANTGKASEAITLVNSYTDRPTNNIPYKIIIRFLEVCKKLSACDEAAELAQAMLKETKLEKKELFGAYFLLGKYFDEKKEYETAFKFFSEGNRIKDTNPAAHENRLQEMQKLISAFDLNTFNSMASTRQTTERPVFIVGMPRSGTSLVEQILTTHPSVFGTGEELPISQFVNKYITSSTTKNKFPECLLEMTSSDMEAMSDFYLETLRNKADSDEYLRITNKVPNNFKYLILINKLFPNARIIHCMRNPLDNCLSVFFQTFAGTHAYAYNLNKLGEYYNAYTSLMEHMRNNLGIEMLNIQYEKLVQNQEFWSREIVKYCNLEWNDACLLFHKNRRQVKTASQEQVNKPIYHSSIDRWKNYAIYIEPLIETLNETDNTNAT